MREIIFSMLFSSLSNRSSGISRILDDYRYIALSSVLLAALLIRILALVSWNNSIYADFLAWDEQVYHQWAKALAYGTSGFPIVCDFTPLYAYIAAAVYKILSPVPEFLRVLNIFLGVSTCWLAYLVGNELDGPVTGFFSSFISALYKPYIFFSITLMKTSLSLFLFSLVIYIFLNALKKYSPGRFLCLGGAAGLLLNVRANCIFMIPILIAVIVFIQYKKGFPFKIMVAAGSVYMIGVLAASLPFSIRNYHLTGTPGLLASGGFNLYIGYNPRNHYPYYRPVAFASSSPRKQAVQFIIEASRRSGEKLSASEASAYWISETMRLCINDPQFFLKKTFQKTLVLFHHFESADNFHIKFISNFIPFFKLPFLDIWMLLPVGLAGMAVMAGRSANVSALALVLVSYAVTMVIIFTNVRIRLPVMVVLIPMSLAGVKRIKTCVIKGRTKTVCAYSFILFFFLILSFLPVKGTNDLTAHYNTHAINLYKKGAKQEAVEYWEKSVRMGEAYSAFAALSLARHYIAGNNLNKGLEYLDLIPDSSFVSAYKYEKIGDVALKRGNKKAAITAYEKSFKINGGRKKIIFKLIQQFRNTDIANFFRMKKELSYISSFYHFTRK